jgi:predicted HTH transcriptional regulator
MKNQTSYNEEFRELTGDLAEAVNEDSIAIGSMLYTIAEEKKNNNLVVKDINAKFDQMMTILERIANRLEEIAERSGPSESGRPDNIDISNRDGEILEFVKSHKRVCADDVQNHFKYKGRNAASARLNKLFRDNIVEKVYAGRNVYYTLRNP